MKRIGLILVSIFLLISYAEGQYNRKYFYYKAQRSISSGDYRSAVSYMSILIDNDDNDFEAFFYRAIAKYSMNDLAGAERDLTKAIFYHTGFAQAYQYRAIVRAMQGNYDLALKDFELAIEQRPDFTEVFYSRGVTLFLNQQFEEAIKDFTHCLKLKPDMIDAHINRGAAYLLLKDTTAAMADYNMAIDKDYRNSNIYVRRAMIYSQQKKYALAYRDYNDAIKFDSLSVAAYFNRALINAQTNKYKDAVADFSRVLDIDPKNSLTYFNRAILLSQVGDYDNALKDYDKVVELTPNNVLGVYNRAMLNAKQGNLINALEDYSKAIDLYPDFANAYMNRSNVKYLLQDMEGSKSDNDIAKEKIDSYRSRMDQASFESMVDTSKVMDRLLSFDLDFGNKEFDGVQGKKFDIKQLPQYRLSFAESPEELRLNRKYRVKSLSSILNDYGNNMVLSFKENSVEENALLEELSRPENRLYFAAKDRWKQFAFDAIIQSTSKQYYNAINLYTKAIANNLYEPYLYAARAVAYSEMTEFISTIDTKSQKLVIGIDNKTNLKTYNITYSYAQAMDDINLAIEMDPNVAYFYYNRGVIKCLNGDMTGAISDYTMALTLYPNFAEALYNRGMIQLYIKETQKGFLDISRSSDLGLQDSFEVLESFGNMLEKK